MQRLQAELPCKVSRFEVESALVECQPVMSPAAALAYAAWLGAEQRGWHLGASSSRSLFEEADCLATSENASSVHEVAAALTTAGAAEPLASSGAAPAEHERIKHVEWAAVRPPDRARGAAAPDDRRNRRFGAGLSTDLEPPTSLARPYVLGKRTLTETSKWPNQAPVQAKLRVAGATGPEVMAAAVRRGVSGGVGRLPYLDIIQRAFGRHDVSQIQAHTDSAAVAGTEAMGALAFAHGDHVAFAGAPDLHTAAHEAAHVIQQRAGLALTDGFGRAGDRHEQHADAVADAVVAGHSVEAMLDLYAPRPAAPTPDLGAPVQHKYKYEGVGEQEPGWVDKDGQRFTLALCDQQPTGIVLTFHATQGGSPQYFTIPAMVGGSKFARVEPGRVIYADGDGKERVFDDLNVFTDYQPSKAKSKFPALAYEDYRSEFHNTAFLGRVSLIPIGDTHGEHHTSRELWVKDVKVSNDRPPTKFGNEGQRSHTVAWTLLRASLQNLGGQPLDEFIALLGKLTQRFTEPTDEDAGAAAKALFRRLGAALDKLNDITKPRHFASWQRAASELISNFVHAYQLSEAATYANGRAIGHGESRHMATLRDAEAALRAGLAVEISEVTTAAVGLLDFNRRLEDALLSEILHHWINQLYLAFPRVMAMHGQGIVEHIIQGDQQRRPEPLTEITGKPTTLDVRSERELPRTALHAKNQSSFVANVVVVPTASVLRFPLKHEKINHGTRQPPSQHTVAHGRYTIDQIQIEAVAVANDRPNTRFGARQRSHTVAWSLIRRHLAGFAGKPARKLATFMKNELNTLKHDIGSRMGNKNITFNASGEAASIAKNVMCLIVDSVGHPLHQWQIRLSELVETYVTLYQLSRSATYSKEEQPKGRGEARALQGLQDLEADLAADQVADLNALFAARRTEIVDWSVALIDAVIATSSLKPQHWMRAIQHWLRLLSDQYPRVTKLPGFANAVKTRISVMEPESRLLAAYKSAKQLSARSRVLINLYENARLEVRYVSSTFRRNLRKSIGLQLADIELHGEDWSQHTNSLEPSDKLWNKWQLQNVRRTTRITRNVELSRKTRSKWQTQNVRRISRNVAARDVPNDKAISSLIEKVKVYFAKVQGDRELVVDEVFKRLSKRLSKRAEDGQPSGAQQADIKQAIATGVDEALELSSLATIKNYQTWYELLVSIDAKLPITYETLSQAIKAKYPRASRSSAAAAPVSTRLIKSKRIAKRKNATQQGK